MESAKKILIFSDRDGTINKDENYFLGSNEKWREQVEFLPGVIKGIKLLNNIPNSYFFIVTNQSGVALKGEKFDLLTEQRMHEVNNYIIKKLNEEGLTINGCFACPFVDNKYVRKSRESGRELNLKYINDSHPDIKPRTGMIDKALKSLNLQKKDCLIFMIGDRFSDVKMGINAGGTGILIESSKTQELGDKEKVENMKSRTYVARDFLDATEFINNTLNRFKPNIPMNKKPKICFVTSFFYPTLGGVETHIQNTAKELIKLGYDCEAYVSDMDRDNRIKKAPNEIDKIKIKRFKSWFKFSFSGIFFPGLFRAVKNSDADIFHIHGYRHPFNFIFWFTKKPVFITPHWPVYRGQRKKWAQFLVDLTDKFLGKYIFKHFSKVCVVTELETPWVQSFNKKKKDIILTPNCIPDDYFKEYNSQKFRKKYDLKKDDLVVLTVSRLHPSKGIDQLVKIAKNFPNVKFILMGKDGGFQKDLEKLIKQLNLKNIIITGEVTEQEKLQAYAGADIFCSPSHYEAFCISILEAMSQGCAVLTSDAGGMPWVVGKEGLTFQDYNLEDFKNQLSKLINNKKLRQDFQKQGKIKVQNFKWKNTAKTLDKEYRKHLNNS